MLTLLAGGWGYENLGDEAILAGYLGILDNLVDVGVVSADPSLTFRAQGRGDLRLLSEYSLLSRIGDEHAALVLGGGGYLNGHWVGEVGGKANRLARHARGKPVIAHAIEARELGNWPLRPCVESLLGRAQVSVRDEKSKQALSKGLGIESKVVPDAISLFYTSIGAYRSTVREMRGRVLLNLLDVPGRKDSNEGETDPGRWVENCRSLIDGLGTRAVGLALNREDMIFMSQFGDFPVVFPQTVSSLVSLIGSCSGLVSVRMHPALIGTMLGTRTLAVAYCGKVRPTLRALGLEDALLSDLSCTWVLDGLSRDSDFSDVWTRSSRISEDWLLNALEGV